MENYLLLLITEQLATGGEWVVNISLVSSGYRVHYSD